MLSVDINERDMVDYNAKVGVQKLPSDPKIILGKMEYGKIGVKQFGFVSTKIIQMRN